MLELVYIPKGGANRSQREVSFPSRQSSVGHPILQYLTSTPFSVNSAPSKNGSSFCKQLSDISGWPLFGWNPIIIKGWDWLSATEGCSGTEMCANWANSIQTLHLSIFSSLRKRHSELTASCSWPRKYSQIMQRHNSPSNTKKLNAVLVEHVWQLTTRF